MNVLIVAAHPDDEIIGCGGTIAKMAGENKITTLILGEGITSRDLPQEEKDTELERLKENCRAANTSIGVKDVFFENFPDNRFDSIPILDIIKPVENFIRKIRPEQIFTHHSGDLNIDHRITQQAVLTAARPFGDTPVRRILAFEVLSSTEWNTQSPGMVFMPNTWIDISGTLERKIEAMKAYTGELRRYPHPRSLEGMQILASRRGLEIGCQYAEAFCLLRSIE